MNLTTTKISTWTWILFYAAFLATPGRAAVTLRSDSRLWLEGGSTLHPYASTATILNLSLEPAAGATSLPALESMISGGGVQTLNLVIPVTGLKSGEKSLDKNMYATLGADRFPEIRFHMDRYEVSKTSGSESVSLKAAGKLDISGVEKPVELQGEMRRTQDSFELKGSYRLLMTDFGVKPPTFMMGVLKVKDPVTIYFDLYLVPGAETIGTKQANK